MIIRKALALVRAAKEGQESKGRSTPRLCVHAGEKLVQRAQRQRGMAQVPTVLDWKWLILGWLWLIMFSQSSVLRVKAPVASDHKVLLSKDVASSTES